jgi:hypothetical protein
MAEKGRYGAHDLQDCTETDQKKPVASTPRAPAAMDRVEEITTLDLANDLERIRSRQFLDALLRLEQSTSRTLNIVAILELLRDPEYRSKLDHVRQGIACVLRLKAALEQTSHRGPPPLRLVDA